MAGRHPLRRRLRRGRTRASRSSAPRRLRATARRVWHAPLPVTAAGMVLVLCAVIAFGANRSADGRPPAAEVTTSETPTPTPTPTPAQSPTSREPVDDVNLTVLQAQVEAIESRYGVQTGLGVAGIAPVGQYDTPTWTAGSLTSGPALGTLDVPIGVAVLDLDSLPSNLTYMLTKSISESSLSSTEALYTFLGSPEAASKAVNEVFQEYGDQVTTVATSTDRQGVPAFTQTDWTVASQSEFAGQLWCSSSDSYITNRMGFIDDEHSYGLGGVVSNHVSVSEGTTEDGSVVLRQMAVIPTATGERVGVSLVVRAPAGQTTTAREAADAVAGRVYFAARSFEGGHC